MKLSRKFASTLRFASIIALAMALVPVLAGPARAGGTITQVAPFANASTVSAAASSGFTGQLATSGGTGTVTFLQTSGSGVTVDSTGAITVPAPLAAGSYPVGGTDSDTSSDTGSWTYTLTVGTIGQVAPTSNTGIVTPATSSGFTDKLHTNDLEAVTYIQTGSSAVTVDLGGNITVAGPLSVGSYPVSGTDSDADGDTGSWSYSLVVSAATLVTTATNSTPVTPSGTPSFTDTLATSGGVAPLIYSQSSGSPEVVVSSSGAVSTNGYLDIGNHVATGTVSDSYGDLDSWTYTLHVSIGTISQSAPTGTTLTPASTATFDAQLAITGNANASSVLFFPSEPSNLPGLDVSSLGAVSTNGVTVAVGSYAISGTDQDTYGDAGSWAYTLTVSAGAVTQTGPFTNTVTTTGSKNFSDQLHTTGNLGSTEIFVPGAPSNPAGVLVSSSGAVATSGSLAVGAYAISGTVIDGVGDTGSWSYTLTVSATSIAQSSPTTNGRSITPASSSNFTDQLAAGGGVGAVSFATTGSGSTPAGVHVSSTGVVTTAGTIGVGAYVISGTDSDGYGDTGSWSYALKVTAAPITQSAPKSNATTPSKSSQFTDRLKTSGGTGGITFSQSTGAPRLRLSSSGKVTVGSTLARGNYTATGKVTDSYGDSGTWTYTLTVSASAITQAAPKSNGSVVTPPTSSKFTAHLAVTGNNGAVKYVLTNGHSTPTGLVISSSGAVSTTGALAVGTYTAAGTDSDSLGDSGPWSYSLTITATKITQSTPIEGATTTAAAFAGKLKVAGSYGTVTYSQASGKPSVTVSSSGAVSSPATLAAGVYKATGTVKDSYRDTAGTWSFSLTVTATKITQATPNSANVATNKVFSGQLKVSGAHGTVTYTQTRGAPDLRVSTSGAVSAPANLARGIYTASGTDFDSLHDIGTWSYTLIVGARTIHQVGSARSTITVGTAFSGQLKVSGSHGKVTYAETKGTSRLKVSSSGKVSAPADLAKGTYKAKGTDSDTFGDKGSWTFTLTVNGRRIAQVTPVTAATTTGKTFTGQLKFLGTDGRLTYTQSRGAPSLEVSSAGAISASGNLPAGSYRANGTAKDSYGDTGSWSFTLSVDSTRLLQIAPVSGTIIAGKAFAAQLNIAGSHGTVTYAQSNGAPHLTVASSGAISAPATLTAGIYKASGSTRDSLGDGGLWAFTLTVTGRKLTQLAPMKATIVAGKAFTERLKISGGHSKLTYSESNGSPELKVSSAGVLSTLSTLKAGTYKATGSVKDRSGDSGNWRFTLTVKAPTVKVTTLKQISPTTGRTLSGTAFTAQLNVAGAHGKVTFTQLTGAQVMTVSSSGKVSAPDTLAAATYTVTGTAKDRTGDTCKWTFTLVVAA